MRVLKYICYTAIISMFVSMGFSFYVNKEVPTMNVRDIASVAEQLKNVKISPPNSHKRRKPLWDCGCENIKKSCSRGFFFPNMLEAANFAKQRCGDDCMLKCQAQNLNYQDEEESSE